MNAFRALLIAILVQITGLFAKIACLGLTSRGLCVIPACQYAIAARMDPHATHVRTDFIKI